MTAPHRAMQWNVKTQQWQEKQLEGSGLWRTTISAGIQGRAVTYNENDKAYVWNEENQQWTDLEDKKFQQYFHVAYGHANRLYNLQIRGELIFQKYSEKIVGCMNKQMNKEKDEECAPFKKKERISKKE